MTNWTENKTLEVQKKSEWKVGGKDTYTIPSQHSPCRLMYYVSVFKQIVCSWSGWHWRTEHVKNWFSVAAIVCGFPFTFKIYSTNRYCKCFGGDIYYHSTITYSKPFVCIHFCNNHKCIPLNFLEEFILRIILYAGIHKTCSEQFLC